MQCIDLLELISHSTEPVLLHIFLCGHSCTMYPCKETQMPSGLVSGGHCAVAQVDSSPYSVWVINTCVIMCSDFTPELCYTVNILKCLKSCLRIFIVLRNKIHHKLLDLYFTILFFVKETLTRYLSSTYCTWQLFGIDITAKSIFIFPSEH